MYNLAHTCVKSRFPRLGAPIPPLDGFLHDNVSESVYFTVQSCETAFELWKKLSETYEKKVASTKMYLIRRLFNLPMKESDSVQAQLNEYDSLSSQITSQGTTIEDELRAMILMSSLPSSWKLSLQPCAMLQRLPLSTPKSRAQS